MAALAASPLLLGANRNETAAPEAQPVFHYHIVGDDHGSWPRVLSALGLAPGTGGIEVIPATAQVDPAEWKRRAEQGTIVILEGDSAVARALGFRRQSGKSLPIRNIVDARLPKLEIIWEKEAYVPRYDVPAQARVFAKEKWQGLPVMAGVTVGLGAALWVATAPGEKGYERFPYLPQALSDLGWRAGLKSRRLWAFFDWSYRTRADLDYFAKRWREAGISALHVAAWHFWEPDAERDAYLKRLIEACHRQAVQVYAWIEFPHVSEKFWQDHPDWREKTALLQDAHLDWRRLMNLQNPACAREVAAGASRLFDRFDWDGINLAELYFESLEGHANAARFTPMNDNVRREFSDAHGFDPHELFDPSSSRNHSKDATSLRTWLAWRAGLAQRMQEHWIAEMEKIRRRHSQLDLVLTHVDDRYDTRMRDLIGADAARLLPLLQRHDFTFLVEDPATIWHLGPERYSDIASKYQPITTRPDRLAIDINIVERYQDVYPTKQQTGIELFQLLQLSSKAFPKVALYFENSILQPDLKLMPAASAIAERIERRAGKLVVNSKHGIGVAWTGPARVNGEPWPYRDDSTVWLPAGPHVIESAQAEPPLRLLDFNGDIRTIVSAKNTVEFAYHSQGRAFAVVDRLPSRVEVDGGGVSLEPLEQGERFVIPLPRGQHVVILGR